MELIERIYRTGYPSELHITESLRTRFKLIIESVQRAEQKHQVQIPELLCELRELFKYRIPLIPGSSPKSVGLADWLNGLIV